MAGPARAIWLARRQNTGQPPPPESGLPLELAPAQSPLSKSDLAAALDGAATLITGTGWASCLEHDARELARERGIRSIAVIDHWTNYADRFIRNGKQVLPDEIWVSDPYAAEIAQAAFPSLRVVQQANAYLAGLVAEVKSRQLPGAAHGNDRVQYVG